MFTGIIESLGKIIFIKKEKQNLVFGIQSAFANKLKSGQSVAHNGACLTVERLIPIPSPKEKGVKSYLVTAVKETLSKTNLGLLKKGDAVNLERSLKVGSRLDGHFVQGHVDCTAKVKSIKKEKGSWIFEFRNQKPETRNQKLIIEKGSICVNGVSLTVVEVKKNIFSVTIIPHTFSHTNFSTMKKGDKVNIEFDVLGKYILNQSV